MPRWRLPASRWYGYALRGVLFGGILLLVGMPAKTPVSGTSKRNTQASLDICWLRKWLCRHGAGDWSQPPEAIGVAILLTALIIAAASNTFKHRLVGYFVPVYMVLLMLALRRVGAPEKSPRRIAGLVLLRALFVRRWHSGMPRSRASTDMITASFASR